jgi:PAS domain S-box-containing protein
MVNNLRHDSPLDRLPDDVSAAPLAAPLDQPLQTGNERFVATVLDTVGALVVVLDRAGRIVRFNRACERLTGYAAADVQQQFVWDLFLVPEEVEAVKTVFSRLQAGDFLLDFENYWVTRNGERRLIAWANTILTADDGAVDYVIGTGIDITEQRAAEQEIKHMSSFPQLNPNPVLEVDAAGEIVFCNASALKTLERIGCNPDPRLFLPPDLPKIIQTLQGSQAAVIRREIKIAHAYFAESLHRAPGFDTIRIFTIDITDRKQTEEALRRSEERYALAQRAANIGSWDWDILNDELHWSDRLEPLFGLPPGAFGGTYEDFLNCVHPEDRRLVSEAVAASIETGKSYDIEHRVIWPNGEVHWIAEAGDVFRDEYGQAVRMRGVAHDVTERRQFLATLQESNAELQARNEELNAFAHTVAHDIKNPLQLIVTAAEMLDTHCSADQTEDVHLPLDIILRGAQKLNAITDSLLLLSEVRRSEVQLEPLNMGAIVAEARQRLGQQLDATVKLCVPDCWPTALGYAPWIEEVWSNFLINALKYGGRPLHIALGGERLPTGKCRFWVRDNGVGVSPAIQANLFTAASFTPGLRRRGHGLGLSIVKRIVEKLGGEVGVQSSGVPGEGSEFSFTLPAT